MGDCDFEVRECACEYVIVGTGKSGEYVHVMCDLVDDVC